MTPLTSSDLSSIAHVRHGFFDRTGGISTGIYASLNCGYGSNDAPASVRENRSRVAAQFGLQEPDLLTIHQIHSDTAEIVRHVWSPGSAPQGDAMATDRPGIAIGILTADCAPVLLADRRRHVIGAAHAGWKGALSGITDKTIEKMESLGARRSDIVAVIGPCISQPAYEVGGEFRMKFIQDAGDNARWFIESDRPDHFRFDLPGYVATRLKAAGVGTVATLGRCTYSDEDSFYSFRRTTHRGEPDYGRQISVIALA